MRLHCSENEEIIRNLANLGKAGWRNPACTGRGEQKVNAGADVQWDVAKQAKLWTFPDFARYDECLMEAMNALDEQVTVPMTIQQDVDFI